MVGERFASFAQLREFAIQVRGEGILPAGCILELGVCAFEFGCEFAHADFQIVFALLRLVGGFNSGSKFVGDRFASFAQLREFAIQVRGERVLPAGCVLELGVCAFEFGCEFAHAQFQIVFALLRLGWRIQ